MSLLDNKPITFRSNHFLTAWRHYAPDVEIAGFSIDDLAADIAEAHEIREQIAAARTQVAGLILKRAQKDEEIRENLGMIASMVRGSPKFGYDCPFYRALGYIPKSEQRRGRPRKAKPDAI
jgi:hypothetical protein